MTKMTNYLDIHNNNFNGTIPTTVGQLTNMESYFDLSCSGMQKLTGTVPTQFGMMTMMTNYLNLQVSLGPGAISAKFAHPNPPNLPTLRPNRPHQLH